MVGGPVTNLLSLRSTSTLHCLLCNMWIFLLSSWHRVKLCQKNVQKEEEVSISRSSVLLLELSCNVNSYFSTQRPAMYDTYEWLPSVPHKGTSAVLSCWRTWGSAVPGTNNISHYHEWLLPGTTLDGLAMISKVWYLPGSPWEALKWVLRWTTSP